MAAWEFAYANKHNLSLDYILQIHQLLMNRLWPKIAGQLRDRPVRIDGDRRLFVSRGLLIEE